MQWILNIKFNIKKPARDITGRNRHKFCGLSFLRQLLVSAEHIREIREHVHGVVCAAFHSGRLYIFGDAQVGVGVQSLKINADLEHSHRL